MTEEQLIKRAEEYGHEWGTPTDDSYACCRQGFIDGYHEGFKDCAKARLNVTTISDCPIKFEWHYVKNELPTNTGLYLIYYKDAFFDINVRTIARYSPDRKEFLNINIEDGDDVIAWCELPEPPEEIK